VCGISGWLTRGNEPWRPTREFIGDLIEGIQSRGHDATGYGTLEDSGDIYVVKGPIMPWRFVQNFKKAAEHPIGRVGILHTRGANVGDPEQNCNNHPVIYEEAKKAVMVVHNGTVGNLEKAYEALGIEPAAEVDSALIAAALGKLGAIEGMKFLIKHSGGSGSIAAIFSDGSLLLARDLSPLFIAQPKPGVMLWSSELQPMQKASENDNEFGMPMWRVWGVKDSSYWYWNGAGDLISKGDFRLPAMTKPPEYIKNKGVTTPFQPGGGATELEKHFSAKKSTGTDLVKLDAAPDMAERQKPENKIAMEPEHNVPCNWGGCFKRSVFRVFWKKERWVPLCQTHTNKWQYKGQSIVLSGTHEMARKMVAVAGFKA